MSKELTKGMFEKLTPALMVITVALAFTVGILWNKVSALEGGGINIAGTNTGQGGNTAGAAAPPANGKLSVDQASRLPEITDADHIKGSRDAKVTLVEYSDFECPFCSRFHPTAQQVVDEYDGQVSWVYRHFPLDSLHPRARAAAIASECVAELGGNDAFWSFVDGVFANQSTALSDLSGTAVSMAGVNQGAFDSCLDEKRYEDHVASDYQSGSDAGVTGTPGNFIVNDKGDVWILPGAVPYESLKAVIDEALAS